METPVRVAVISRNHIVRAGLVSLIAQLRARAIVTQAESLDENLEPHDVAVYDLGAVARVADYTVLQRLMDDGTQVIGLVYDNRDTLPPEAAATSHVITLSVTPEQLLRVLRATTPLDVAHDGPPTRVLPAGLTQREFEVLELIGAGLTNEEIAKRIYLSINSVKTYVRQAYRKIGARDRTTAVRWAMDHGLAGPHADEEAAGARPTARRSVVAASRAAKQQAPDAAARAEPGERRRPGN